MSRHTRIELCLDRDQHTTLALVIKDHGDRVRDLLAEALYAAKLEWNDGTRAAPIIVRKFAKFYRAQLFIGSQRGVLDATIVVDFISQHVTDIEEGRGCSFGKWLKKHDVP